MKSASKVFYTVGFVFAIISLLVSALFLALTSISMNNPEIIQKLVAESGRGEEFIRQALLLLVVLLAVSTFLDALIIVLTILAWKSLKEENGKMSTHIILLIVGLFGVNFFYLLGGIFGIVAANEDAQL